MLYSNSKKRLSLKSGNVYIALAVPPDIINEETSADVSARELDNVTLSCRATGHPPPKITWKREDHEPLLLKRPGGKDFFKVESYVGSALQLWRVDRKQMGAFLCIASNDVPPAVSKRITLRVNFSPTVIAPDQLLGSPLGADVVLECAVEAYPTTINYWLKNRGEMLLDGPKYIVSEERSSYKAVMKLTIQEFGRGDIGTYNCVSTNSLGKSEGTLRLYEIKLYPSSQASEVSVGVPPDIINEETSADVSARELDNVTLSCRATGHPPPKITWKREDHEPLLLKRPGGKDFFKVESYVGSALQLWRVDRKQMGAFLCIASNDVPPAVSKRITLRVNFSPTVIAPDQLLGSPLGADVVLECAVEAYPTTINYWLKNRGEMLLDGPKYIVSEERSSYKAVMMLTIREFGRGDIGTYNCVSTNSLGKSEGTLRLYEIKLYPSSQASEVSVGGLTEDAMKQKNNYNFAGPKVNSNIGLMFIMFYISL